jgi:tartrate-resistant acid phosphatase type 5
MKRLLALTLSVVLLTSCSSSGPQTVAPASKGGPACAPPPVIDGPDKDTLRLLAVGDAGLPPDASGSLLRQTLNGMKAISDPDAVLVLGDNVYTCGLRNVDDPNWNKVIAPLFEVGKPVYPVLGNHDWGRPAIQTCSFSNPNAEIDKSGTPGFKSWIFPAASYVLRTRVAEIVFFDSTPIAEGWSTERERALCSLRTALAQPKSRPWRVVVAHHPLYSCGEHGAQKETVRMRQAVESLLKESGVDLYLSGHDHDLEIRNEPASPLFVVSGSGSKIRAHGATCLQGPTFKIVGGFTVIDVTADDLQVSAHCNGQSKPCMQKRLSRSALAAGL